ncbi:MAG: aldolase/citrate lyase family protein [Alphaproteobacteria bacterium]|nr:aldolase/citrate lyase family protein [Alphaproteobacteria bacterium]
MRKNNVLETWKAGGAVVNGWLAIPSGFSAEVMAGCGWDSVTIDLQHGMVDYTAAVPMLQGISLSDATPMARVPWLEPGIIQKLLDAGSYGIICPMINTRAECELLVACCNYAPKGSRSFGPIRAVMYAGADYGEHANDTVLAIAMIETQQAIDNLDDILSTPGLDGIYVGPSDLSLSLGHAPQLDTEVPEVVAAIDTILAGAKKHGVPAGLHCGSPDYAARMFEKGFQLATIANDSRLMAQGAMAAVAALKGRMADSNISGSPY